jgi:hypothetical protein
MRRRCGRAAATGRSRAGPGSPAVRARRGRRTRRRACPRRRAVRAAGRRRGRRRRGCGPSTAPPVGAARRRSVRCEQPASEGARRSRHQRRQWLTGPQACSRAHCAGSYRADSFSCCACSPSWTAFATTCSSPVSRGRSCCNSTSSSRHCSTGMHIVGSPTGHHPCPLLDLSVQEAAVQGCIGASSAATRAVRRRAAAAGSRFAAAPTEGMLAGSAGSTAAVFPRSDVRDVLVCLVRRPEHCSPPGRCRSAAEPPPRRWTGMRPAPS